MPDKKALRSRNEDDEIKFGKARYSQPNLRVFGTVSDLTNGTNTVGTDSGFGNDRQNRQSDRATKENWVRIGEHPLGIGLYLFDYMPEFRDRSGHGRQFGVMADEVESVMPGAVSIHPDGYKTVNYAMLGITIAKC